MNETELNDAIANILGISAMDGMLIRWTENISIALELLPPGSTLARNLDGSWSVNIATDLPTIVYSNHDDSPAIAICRAFVKFHDRQAVVENTVVQG